MLNFRDFIQVFVLTTNHYIKCIKEVLYGDLHLRYHWLKQKGVIVPDEIHESTPRKNI